MEQIVYFQDKTLKFSSVAPDSTWFALRPASLDEVTRAKVLFFLEIHNKVALVTPDPHAAYQRFAADFSAVEAAGGVVVNGDGNWLMIHRNGRWDLPKGRVEAGEDYDVCAAREIEEETGVAAELLRPLCTTCHGYYSPYTERWELKRTHWYLLRTNRRDRLTPQREEGIEQAVWCSREAVDEHLNNTFPTIRVVIAALRSLIARP